MTAPTTSRRMVVLLVAFLTPVYGWAAGAYAPDRDRSESVDVSGTWLLEDMRMVASTCPAPLTDTVRDALRRGDLNCTYFIHQRGTVADVVEMCPDQAQEFVARVDPSGELRRSQSVPVDVRACRWMVTTMFSSDLSHSPTVMTAMYVFAFEPRCGIPDCAMELSGRMERVEWATAADSARTRNDFASRTIAGLISGPRGNY